MVKYIEVYCQTDDKHGLADDCYSGFMMKTKIVIDGLFNN